MSFEKEELEDIETHLINTCQNISSIISFISLYHIKT